MTTQNGISLIRLIPESGPGDPATATLVHTIRDHRAAIEGQTGAHILVGGTTASNLDVSAKLSAALPVFLIVVAGLAFILLTFAFGTILVPATSILGFLLSMAAALGAQVAMFQWGWGQHIFGIPPAQTISILPVIMLAIIFGLSSDYEMFVVSRIKEDYTRNGDARRAVQRGTGLSARVVTAAALIMFSIFVAFMFTSDPTIKAIGFSFAAGVFLDAFVVRLTLVPAIMAITGSRIWYHPQWFARHIPDPDIEGQRLARKPAQRELAAAGTLAGRRGRGHLYPHALQPKLRVLSMPSSAPTPDGIVGVLYLAKVKRRHGPRHHPPPPVYTGHTGGAPATAPARAGIWAARAAGPGTQTLTWPDRGGSWTVAAMNADGSRPVAVRISVAAALPSLPWIAAGLLAGGVLALAAGRGSHRRSRTPRSQPPHTSPRP